MTNEQTKSIQAQLTNLRKVVMELLIEQKDSSYALPLAQYIEDRCKDIEMELYNPEPVQPEFKGTRHKILMWERNSFISELRGSRQFDVLENKVIEQYVASLTDSQVELISQMRLL
jgi:hypothetical protein